MPHFSAKSYPSDLLQLTQYHSLSNGQLDGIKSKLEKDLRNSEQSQNYIAAQKSAWLLSRLAAQESMGEQAMYYAKICAKHCELANLQGANKIYGYDALCYAYYSAGQENEGFAYEQLVADIVEMLAQVE